MIIQRRKFLIGLASSLAAPAIVKAANIMPVKAFSPKATMQGMLNYYASAQIEYTQLDVLYGSLYIGDMIKFDIDNKLFTITAISANELYHDR